MDPHAEVRPLPGIDSLDLSPPPTAPQASGPVSLSEAFEELRKATGRAWDGVDPDAFVREIRGDDAFQ